MLSPGLLSSSASLLPPCTLFLEPLSYSLNPTTFLTSLPLFPPTPWSPLTSSHVNFLVLGPQMPPASYIQSTNTLNTHQVAAQRGMRPGF